LAMEYGRFQGQKSSKANGVDRIQVREMPMNSKEEIIQHSLGPSTGDDIENASWGRKSVGMV
jgi:hypothetical protein